MIKNMAEGATLPLIIKFALPLVGGNLIQQLYNFADGWFVSRYVSQDSFGAVGITGSLTFLILGLVLGATAGFCIKVSQNFGAGNYKEMRKYVVNGIYLCTTIAVVLTAVSLIFCGDLLRLLETPEAQFKDAYDYVFIIFFGIVAICAYDYCAALLRALGDSKSPFVFLAIACVTNIILDAVFVGVCGFGVRGAAIATIISQGLSAVLSIIYIIKKFPILKISDDERKFSSVHSVRQLQIGLPMAFQYSITAIGVIIVQKAINKLGTEPVNAVTAALKISTLTMLPFDSLGITMANFCGQNIGAGKIERVKKGMIDAFKIFLVWGVCSSVLLMFGGIHLVKILFIGETQIRTLELAQKYLFIDGVWYWSVGILLLLRNSLQGMGYGILPMFAGIAELAGRLITVLFFAGTFGYTAICYSDPAAWLVADAVLIPAWFICFKQTKNKMLTPKKI